MNEETIIENRPTVNGQNESKNQSDTWKKVTLGGVSGILMGAGLLYAGQAVAATKADASEETGDAATAEAQQAENAAATMPVAQMHNDLSFGEAFAAARAEVGPGGVFIWHSGIYNTYTEDEWNAMTPEQKNDFAQRVNPTVHVHEISTPTDGHPNVVVVVQPSPDDSTHANNGTQSTSTGPEIDPEVVQSYQQLESDDVHLVGFADANGHLMAGYDVTGDGQVDVAIIDVGEPGLSGDDQVVTKDGSVATVDQVVEELKSDEGSAVLVEDGANSVDPDPYQVAGMENPDVAPGMDDYMNNANVDDMNVII